MSKQKNLCACGCGQEVKTPGRKLARGHFTEAMRQRWSEQRKRNNPMHNPESLAKRVAHTDYAAIAKKISETRKRLFAEGKIKPTQQKAEWKAASSARMKQNNPMHRPEVVQRVVNMIRRKKAEGIVYTHTMSDAGRAALSKRMRQNNPMWNMETREKSLGQTRSHLNPSKLELWFGHFCQRNNIPVWYTGTGEFWVHGRNPDFKIHTLPLLIEVTDGYSRKPERRTIENYARPTIAHYEQHGFRCLVVMLPERRQSRSAEMQRRLKDMINQFIEVQESGIFLGNASLK